MGKRAEARAVSVVNQVQDRKDDQEIFTLLNCGR